jgi:hypothetical protein
MDEKSARIRALNDTFRQSFMGGRVMLTPAVQALRANLQAELLVKIREFAAFKPSNDPHLEHDFGSIECAGETFFWKIDYYDGSLEHGSEDPSGVSKTIRVMTIMRADQ